MFRQSSAAVATSREGHRPLRSGPAARHPRPVRGARQGEQLKGHTNTSEHLFCAKVFANKGEHIFIEMFAMFAPSTWGEKVLGEREIPSESSSFGWPNLACTSVTNPSALNR